MGNINEEIFRKNYINVNHLVRLYDDFEELFGVYLWCLGRVRRLFIVKKPGNEDSGYFYGLKVNDEVDHRILVAIIFSIKVLCDITLFLFVVIHDATNPPSSN